MFSEEPYYLNVDKRGNYYLVIELSIPISTGKCLRGTDCPAEKCSACGELFEEGSLYCSNCGRKVIRNGH